MFGFGWAALSGLVSSSLVAKKSTKEERGSQTSFTDVAIVNGTSL